MKLAFTATDLPGCIYTRFVNCAHANDGSAQVHCPFLFYESES